MSMLLPHVRLKVAMLYTCALMLSSRSFYHLLGLWHYIMWHVMWLQYHVPLSLSKRKEKEKRKQNPYKVRKRKENKNCSCPERSITVDILLFRLFANWLRTLVNRFVNCHSWNFCNLRSIENRNADNSNKRISLSKIMLGSRDVSREVPIVPKRVL